jgi:hypothetical protein
LNFRTVAPAKEMNNILIPAGVNNRATMPRATQTYAIRGEEVLAIVSAPEAAVAGTVIFNQQISHDSVKRLGMLARTFQRIKWRHCSIHIVALNGSLATSGYNSGFIEDPELNIPTAPSGVIQYLTALRSTAVRQNWVESESGQLVTISDLPEMYTTKGTDLRRYYIGRYAAALTGEPGPNVTFQIMLRYSVVLSVPAAVDSDSPLTDEYIMPADFVSGRSGVTGEGVTTPSLPQPPTGPVPPAGEWLVPNAFFNLKEGDSLLFDGLEGAGYFDQWPKFVQVNYPPVRLYSLVVLPGTTTAQDLRYRTEAGGTIHSMPSASAVTITAVDNPTEADNYTLRMQVNEGPQWLPVPGDGLVAPGDWGNAPPVDFPGGWGSFEPPIIVAGTRLTRLASADTVTSEVLAKHLLTVL